MRPHEQLPGATKMTINVNLLSSDETLEEISHVIDTRKRMVRVDREVLSQMLVDHDVMRNALRSAQFKVITPSKRPRARLTP